MKDDLETKPNRELDIILANLYYTVQNNLIYSFNCWIDIPMYTCNATALYDDFLNDVYHTSHKNEDYIFTCYDPLAFQGIAKTFGRAAVLALIRRKRYKDGQVKS